MIQSCIRDLYELIFCSSKGNDFYSPKLTEYLMNTDKESKGIIKNPKYKDVFQKYEKLVKEDEENFLHNSDDSFERSSFNLINKNK